MYYIGIDLGGTNIVAGIVSENGELLYKDSVPTQNKRHQNEIIKDIADLCLKIIKDFDAKIDEIEYIGIGTPGIVDNENGIIVYANNIKFSNAMVREELQKTFDMPIYLENDANCAALGESTSGAAKGYTHSVIVTLGTGIGGGIVVNGKIYHGAFGQAGEVGHTVINFDGPICTCGRYGCFEVYSSATGLISQTKDAAIKNPKSIINDLVNGNYDKITAKTVFDAAEKGDLTANEVIDKYLDYLSIGVVNIINVLQPDIIVIGGGVCGQGDKIRLPIIQHASKNVFGGDIKTDIAIAKLGNDAGIIGAAMIGRSLDLIQ